MTVFLEVWKRKCSKKGYDWGTLSLTNMEIPRPDYYGKLGRDPITGKMTPQYPNWKTMCQFYLVSVPVILLATAGAAFMALCQFWVEDYLIEKFSYESYIVFLPSIFQALFVAVLTVFYDRFATFLTIKENHRTQSQFERYRVNKLIVLEFVNNFFSLFYIAFIKQDMKMLQSQLMTQMLILQVRYAAFWFPESHFSKNIHFSSFKAHRNFCCPSWSKNIICGAVAEEFSTRATMTKTTKATFHFTMIWIFRSSTMATQE